MKPKVVARVTSVRLTKQDKANAEVIRKRLGLTSRTDAIRAALEAAAA